MLWILLAAIVALLIAVFQYIYKNKNEKSQLNYWLSFLRFLSIFLILLLIINPSFNKQLVEVVKPNLLIAVDNSNSIKYSSQNEYVNTIINKIKSDTELNEKYNVNLYKFGSTLSILDSLNFNETQTNIAKPFYEFNDIYKSVNNPTIIVTDGNQTIGNTVEFMNYKSPVFPVIVGDTTAFEDLYISQLNVNKDTYINNKFPVEVFINYLGENSIKKQFNVYSKGTRIYSKQFEFSKSDNVKIASFYLNATTEGKQYYTTTIEELSNEKNVINNTKNFGIKVIKEESKIAILTSISHPDLGMLKRSIESNKQRAVTINKISDFKGDYSDYQLIILYQPTTEFQNIFKEIKEKQLNYFIITGSSTNWDFLNKNQNYFSKNSITELENYQPVYNPNYAVFLSDDIGFSGFAPLQDQFGDVAFTVPYNSLLFQKIGTFQTEKPLLVTFEDNNQKIAVLLGENIWNWRMNSFNETKTFENFDGFFSNLIQYLSSNQKSKQLNVAVNSFFYANEAVQFSASYLDKNFNFDNRAKLWLTISGTENNFYKKIPFAVNQNRFVIELTNIEPGEYEYTVSVENQKENTSGKFKILPFEVEQQFVNANDNDLKQLSINTQGKIYYNNQEDQLIKDLVNDDRFKNIQKSKIIKTPLIDWKWLLGFVVLLLSLEWFIRKYHGQI